METGSATRGTGTPAGRPFRALVYCLLLILLTSGAFSAPSQAQSTGRRILLAFVGDILLGRHVGEVIAVQGNAYVFESVKPIIELADLAFGNMESPLATTPRVARGYDLRAEPDYAGAISYAGFDIVSLANNHATDNGRDGLLQSMQTLTDLGIEWTGAGETLADARTARVLTVEGLRIGYLAYDGTRASFLATTEQSGCAWLEPDWVVEDVRRAREVVDLLIVSFHWGEEYQSLPNALQKSIASRVASAGADIIVGHHPHVVQPVDWVWGEGRERPTLVAYSLGNFLFDQWFSDETMQSVILLCTAGPNGVEAFGLHPVQSVDGRTIVADDVNSRAVLSRLLPATSGRGWQVVEPAHAGLDPAVWQLAPTPAVSSQRGTVDFDADGTAERVVHAADDVWVYAAGNVTLSNLSGWAVRAWTALPTLDGRLLALSVTEPPAWLEIRQPSAGAALWQSHLMSQSSNRLYVLRWSSNHWEQVARSRAMPHPVQALACADSPDDPHGRCMVIERTLAGTMRLAGWTWDGAGWERKWSAPCGAPAELASWDLDGDGRLEILVQAAVEDASVGM